MPHEALVRTRYVPTVDSVGNFTKYENKGDGSKALTVSFFTLL